MLSAPSIGLKTCFAIIVFVYNLYQVSRAPSSGLLELGAHKSLAHHLHLAWSWTMLWAPPTWSLYADTMSNLFLSLLHLSSAIQSRSLVTPSHQKYLTFLCCVLILWHTLDPHIVTCVFKAPFYNMLCDCAHYVLVELCVALRKAYHSSSLRIWL